MNTNIYMNLGTKNLEKAKNFFIELGFEINQKFTDQNAACIKIAPNIFAMIITEEFFRRFTKKEIIDPTKQTECTNGLVVDDRSLVDKLADKALALGATENIIPEMATEEMIYGRSINDLDGHIWEILWMDPRITENN